MTDRRIEAPLALYQVLEAELEQEYGSLEDSDDERIKIYVAAKKELEEAQKDEELKEMEKRHPDDYREKYEESLKDSAMEWQRHLELNEKLLPALYRLIHSLKRSALCLSGGGIRSATFNLGILQGLARYHMLGEFDYLSTVSGGGFIGGWLSAWIKRKGVQEVLEKLRERPPSSLEPDPKPIYALRTYSNYLSPQKGLLNADTWTLVAVYLRNLLLNWLVFLPVIMTVLMLPRIWLALMLRGHIIEIANAGPILTFFKDHFSLIIGFVGNVMALSYIGVNLPSTANRNDSPRRFLALCLAPLIISAMALSTYWSRIPSDYARKIDSGPFIKFSIGVLLIAWIFCLIFLPWKEYKASGKLSNALRGAGWGTIFIVIAGFIIGPVTWKLAITVSQLIGNLQGQGGRLYATLAVPSLLGLLMIGGTLLAGLTSGLTDDSDQEWWARSGAYLMIFGVGWITLCLIVFFGPTLFLDVGGKLYKSVSSFEWPGYKEMAVGLIAIVSGALSLLGGFSEKTPANESGRRKPSLTSKILVMATNIASLLFLVSILILLALITDWLLYGLSIFIGWLFNSDGLSIGVQGRSLGQWLAVVIQLVSPTSTTPFMPVTDPSQHRMILYGSTAEFMAIAAAIIGFIGWIAGLCINTNKFSLHYYWRNRIMRAYLGASHEDDSDPTHDRHPNEFTGFDPEDDIEMAKLKPSLRSDDDETSAPNQLVKPEERKQQAAREIRQRKLLHVINCALNLVGGDKLAWQDRKAESFSISPLHAGSYWLGYRSSDDYAGGITLGTAVAISGAAASPNMGYMMSSSIVRFIMTLFNVRLGFWLGNPGPAGDTPGKLLGRTFALESPRYSVRPIVAEALGMTNDKSPYVYLSDGGHFENLGLYEMVMRRCRYIVVSDASTDTKYSFDSLAMAIRQIRVDFGVSVEFDKFYIYSPATEESKGGTYFAIGRIRYSCVDEGLDPERDDGYLIYLKPSLIGDEPRDVRNYYQESGDFPQESIADQFFSEAQFESYRMLGSHILDQIFLKSCSIANVNEFFKPATGEFAFEDFTKSLKEKLRKSSMTEYEQKVLDRLTGVARVVQDVKNIPAHLGSIADKLEKSPEWLRELLNHLRPPAHHAAIPAPPGSNNEIDGQKKIVQPEDQMESD
ncbi:MAG TPA: patatin-like phospholipase family protein [Pyrinomonadaceae bacterium]|nr:patatin-like phospholipase family protein [Pyrinomonadaceae bacterium]